jgi:glyoxylase-like metal-dependent hydrolase (beta-lactamase superfamily II)
MSAWSLRLQGVGNAFATELGSAMATIERDGAPWLTIDCGSDGLTHYLAHYGAPPRAVFLTHAHLDHIGGFERLFGAVYWSDALRGRTPLYIPAPLVPLLQQRVASYPNVIAEGGANFWDAFHLVPVGDHFWHDNVRLEVFATRHHWPETSFGLRLHGSMAWTGDTRPSRNNSRRPPTPANSSSTIARCTAILRTAASTIWNASIRRRCSRAAACTTTRAPPMARRWKRAAIASCARASSCRWRTAPRRRPRCDELPRCAR